MKYKTFFIAALLCFFSNVATSEDYESESLNLIKNFYMWVIENESEVSKLEPTIVDIPGSTRFFLDTASLPKFASAFLESGYFSKKFQTSLEAYYIKYRNEFNAYPQKEFDDLAKYGRGPLMEAEDMDIYFCAQEYEYKPEFVEAMKVKSITKKGNDLIVSVISPYDWVNVFKLTNENGKLLISGFCLFE